VPIIVHTVGIRRSTVGARCMVQKVTFVLLHNCLRKNGGPEGPPKT
jgi:hypothetical protein